LTDSSGHASIDSYLLTVAIESGYVGLFFFVVAFLSFLQLCIGGIIGATLRDALELAAITSALFGMFIAFFGLSITHNLTFLWILMIWGLAVRQRIVWTSAHAIPA
jgi:FtsH-binding integral membrane protein